MEHRSGQLDLMVFSEEKKLTQDEVAQNFRCGRKTIARWLKTKPDFPKPYKYGRRNLWKESDINAYAESQRSKTE